MTNSPQYYANGAVKYIRSLAHSSTPLREARLAICNSCINKRDNGRCICPVCMAKYGTAHEHCENCCGCNVEAKTKLPEEYCPQNKW